MADSWGIIVPDNCGVCSKELVRWKDAFVIFKCHDHSACLTCYKTHNYVDDCPMCTGSDESNSIRLSNIPLSGNSESMRLSEIPLSGNTDSVLYSANEITKALRISVPASAANDNYAGNPRCYEGKQPALCDIDIAAAATPETKADIPHTPPNFRTKRPDGWHGCEHYKRKCSLICLACNTEYICRLCHDKDKIHKLDRHVVQQIRCLICRTVQQVGNSCINCGISFGVWYCEICRLYDDEDKKQFHCAGCGICRIGGRENFHHCTTCGFCVAMEQKSTHKCVPNLATKSRCAVCDQNVHSSTEPLTFPPCMHVLHSSCSNQLKEVGIKACLICDRSF